MNWDVQKQETSEEVKNIIASKHSDKVTVNDLIGSDDDEKFLNFDLTEVQNLVSNLQSIGVDDIGHAMELQQTALRCADILSEYIGKIVKTISFLDAKLSSKKNKVALNYESLTHNRTSIELKKMAGESDPEVEDIALQIAKAKGAKSVLEKKYDIVIKAHHHYKDIANGLRRSI